MAFAAGDLHLERGEGKIEQVRAANRKDGNGLKIGSVSFEGKTALAPMAGVADTAFRTLCRQFGASYVVGEMVSSKGYCYGDRKSERLLCVTDEQRPMAVQLFGTSPELMAQCARGAMKYAPQVIDINMGCPAPKITGGGAGSAMMRTPHLAGEIIAAVVDAVPVPVTVKLRKGWDDESVNVVELARIAEENGAAAVTVHGRTRMQMYSGECDLESIRKVVEAVSIPVIGNGDVTNAGSAERMLRRTGCAMVMIGRGALGTPWVFGQIEAALRGETPPETPSWEERCEILRRHVAMMVEDKGERGALIEARKHAAWYFHGLRGAAALRREAGMLTKEEDLRELCAHALVLAGQQEEEECR